MTVYPLSLIPDIPADAAGMQYFWYMLPYAVPGLITFIVGMILAVLGIVRLRRGERIGYYLSFSGTCLGLGMLGFILALRAVIHDEAVLLKWNTYLYPLVLLLAPSSHHLIFFILEKKYRFLEWAAWLNWISTIIAIIGIIKGQAFTGQFLHYSFGKYPVASLYMKPWAIVAASGYFFLALPAYYHYLRNNSFHERRFLVIGHNVSLILVISNLPSFVGIPLFPGSTFSFIPMFILAFGVFNSDFKDLKQLLFEKTGLFYTLNTVVGIVLLVLAGAVLFNFSPANYEKLQWFPWLLIPLFSVFLVVGLGILIGGTNPNQPLNQLGSFSLYIFGFQLLSVLSVSLSSDILIGHRIEQISFMIFCLAPSIQLRFAFLSLNRPLPRILPLFDLVSASMSVLAVSPYLFTGYFEFPWGRFSASGPVIQIYGFVGFVAIAIVLREWWLCRKIGIKNTLGDFAALYVGIAGFMLICNIPATLGFGIYPLGNLSILPTSILVFGVLRYGGKIVKTEAYSISTRLMPFSLLAVLTLIVYIWSGLPDEYSASDRLLHALLSGSPLVLLSFLVTFILIRPIATRIDSAMLSLSQAKETAETQKLETEAAKGELEKLNTITRKINSVSSLADIMSFVMVFLEKEFGFTDFWMALKDESTNELYTYSYIAAEASVDAHMYFKNIRVPLGSDSLLAITNKNQRRVYISDKEEYSSLSSLDQEIINKANLTSILQIPFVIYGQTIGILSLHGRSGQILRTDQLDKIQAFADQIAGSIYNSKLFKEAQEAKETAVRAQEEAEIARLNAEKQREETEGLNKLIKSLNEELNIEVIMEKVSKYVFNIFGVKQYALYGITRDKERVKLISAAFPDFVGESDRNAISNFEIPIVGSGAHAVTFKAKRPFFPQKIRRSSVSKEELFVIDACRIESFLMIPLILQNEPVGILDFFNVGKMELSKEAIIKLSILGEQLAGIVYGSNLLTEVREEKEKADEANIQTEKARQEIEFINEFNKKMNSKLDLEWILSEVLKFAGAKYQFDSIFLLLKESNHLILKTAKVPANSIYALDAFRKVQIPYTKDSGLHSMVYHRRKSYFVKDAPRFKDKLNAMDTDILELFNFKSALYIPLIVQNECIGILDLVSLGKKIFLGKDEQTSLALLGENIGSAIYNSILLEQTERQKQETEDLNRLIKSLNEERDLKLIMDKVIKYANKTFGIQYYSLYEVTPDKNSISLLEINFPDYVSEEDRSIIQKMTIPIKNVKGAFAITIKANRPFYAPRVKTSGITEEELFVIEKYRMQSFLTIPLLLNNEPIGVLNFSNEGKLDLSREDITRLSILGEQLAGIVHGSNLFKQAQEEKEKALAAHKDAEAARAEVQIINNFIKNINSISSLDEILDEIFQFIVNNFSIDFGFIQLKEGDHLQTRKIGNYSNILTVPQLEYIKNLKVPLNETGGVPYKTYKRKKTFFLNIGRGEFSSSFDRTLVESIQLKAFLIVPLIIHDEVIGLAFFTSHNSNFNLKKSEIKRIEGFCNQITGAINNAKLLKETEAERRKSDKLLLNILPARVAEELKREGRVEPLVYDEVSVLFTDFVGFTQASQSMMPHELVEELDGCFSQFDEVVKRNSMEKLKTIGDSYMCAAGVPALSPTHAVDACLAALEIRAFLDQMQQIKKSLGHPFWQLRIGIHSGPVTAGVIGTEKFAYDIWGDTVNTASRMEASGESGEVNISGATYELVKDFFDCEYRGKLDAKGKGVMDMYFVNRIKPELSGDAVGLMPNEIFRMLRHNLENNQSESGKLSRSFVRCVSHPEFYDVFYRRFIGEDAEVREKFRETNMETQKRMLHSIFSVVARRMTPRLDQEEIIHQSAVKHRDMGIGPHLFEKWQSCMIATICEFDSEINQGLEDSWRRLLRELSEKYLSVASDQEQVKM